MSLAIRLLGFDLVGLVRLEFVPAPAMAAGMLNRRENKEDSRTFQLSCLLGSRLARPMVTCCLHPSPLSVYPRFNEKRVGLRTNQAHRHVISTHWVY